jgi:hypothetical protein
VRLCKQANGGKKNRKNSEQMDKMYKTPGHQFNIDIAVG